MSTIEEFLGKHNINIVHVIVEHGVKKASGKALRFIQCSYNAVVPDMFNRYSAEGIYNPDDSEETYVMPYTQNIPFVISVNKECNYSEGKYRVCSVRRPSTEDTRNMTYISSLFSRGHQLHKLCIISKDSIMLCDSSEMEVCTRYPVIEEECIQAKLPCYDLSELESNTDKVLANCIENFRKPREHETDAYMSTMNTMQLRLRDMLVSVDRMMQIAGDTRTNILKIMAGYSDTRTDYESGIGSIELTDPVVRKLIENDIRFKSKMLQSSETYTSMFVRRTSHSIMEISRNINDYVDYMSKEYSPELVNMVHSSSSQE